MLKRVLSALLGFPVFLFVVYQGGYIYLGVVVVVLALALNEYLNMMRLNRLKPFEYLAYIFLIGTTVFTGLRFNMSVVHDLPLYFILLSFLYLLWRYPRRSLDEVAFTALGTLYIVGLGKYFIMLRWLGYEAVIFSFLIAWSYDTCAYFSGLKFGKNRPWKLLSPKKSIEGLVGGILGSISINMLVAWLWGWPLPMVAVFVGVAAFLGQLGDLIESSIKRHFGVKDAGSILPGHGGILDRFDGALVVAPLAYYFIRYVLRTF